jgi:aryl-alcohol dehydrogenase-like predicted oxidoreductase
MNALKTRALGSSGIEVTEIGIGLWAQGGHWGELRDDDSFSAIDQALDCGINFFDTSDVYGHGHSENILGKAMQGRRDKFIVATKIGWVGYDGDKNQSAYTSVEKLIAGVEENMKRLGTDYIDVMQNHVFYKEPNTDIFIEGFERLKELGKIRAFGISSSDFEFIKYFAGKCDCASLQIDYSILNRTAEEEIFPYCQENNIGVIVRGGLAMGLLTGKFTANTTFEGDDFRQGWIDDPEQNKQFRADLESVEKLRPLLAEGTLAQLALRFVLHHPAVSTVIPGGRNAKQVQQNTAAGLLPPLTDEELATISEVVPAGGGRKIWPA